MIDQFQSRVTGIFQNHYSYYTSIGIETIKQQAGQVEQISSDYQGRVIYELLQNAFDKADKEIKVIVKANCLYIANDGKSFTYRENYDYHTGKSDRADFQSLCSISTSTKDANFSIGNKGVGFKSVFAIAESGYAAIHTMGELLDADGNRQRGPVSFRVYDTFKEAERLPQELPLEIKTTMALQISQMQEERKDSGVPGYYYPVLIANEDKQVLSLFNKGFVTIIQVPFPDSIAGEINDLLEEIRKIHFQFVQLRIPKKILISFRNYDNYGIYFDKEMRVGDSSFIYCSLTKQISELAIAAGINIEDPRVAVYFGDLKKDGAGKSLLYNYLPTKIESPFLHVDFHADFHTTVDRKGINWEGKVGAYNRALMIGCMELYFTCLNSGLPENEQQILDIHQIDQATLSFASFNEFTWKYFDVSRIQESYEAVRGILQISNRQYQIASALMAGLAKQYFMEERSLAEHTLFFDNSVGFINAYSRNAGDSYEWPLEFKRKFGERLVEIDAGVIPASGSEQQSLRDELIFREQQKDEIKAFIPSFVGIIMTSFEVKDKELRKSLNIKEYSDRNEILKNYRQVSPTGKFHPEINSYTEDQQKDLLKSIGTFLGRTGENITCTHRYQNFIASKADNSAANQTDFALSTVFLKVKTGKYKPAQLCNRKEIDESFLDTVPDEVDKEVLLRYLGVSPYNAYLFIDKTITISLKDGLNYIPALWKGNRSGADDQLSYDRILQDVRVVYQDNEIHPAIINDSGYAFLKDLKISDFKAEAEDLLIKQYDTFPREYMVQILKACETALNHKVQQEQLLRIYHQIFEPLHQKLKTYLVAEGRIRYFSQKNDFYIAANEADFEIALKMQLPVLCYYKSKVVPDNYGFKGKILDLESSEFIITGEIDCSEQLRDELSQRMFYLLFELSDASYSETNYFENPSKITELSKKLACFKFGEVDTLKKEVKIKLQNMPIIKELTELMELTFDYNERQLYVRKDITESKRAEAISKSIFNNAKFSKTVELILYKTEEVLEKEYKDQLATFYQEYKRHWISDYEKRFQKFTDHILALFDGYAYSHNTKWFLCNSDYESEFLIGLYREGKLNQLAQTVKTESKVFDEGVFSGFQLDIDFSMFKKMLAEIEVVLDRAAVNSEHVFRLRLKALTGKLGVSSEIKLLKADVETVCPNAFNIPFEDEKLENAEKKINLQSKIEQIIQNFKDTPTKNVYDFSVSGVIISPLTVCTLKVIFPGNLQSTEECKVVGNTGEEQVLYFLINYFISIVPIKDRLESLSAVDKLIRSKLPKSPEISALHQRIFDTCVTVLGDNKLLMAALVPFFYITLHYELAFVDLIAWYEGRAVLVEVKTTKYSKNNSFRISDSEINQAMEQENYIIIRVTPDEMVFLGNPVYEIQQRFTKLEGSNFSIQPDGYKFIFCK